MADIYKGKVMIKNRFLMYLIIAIAGVQLVGCGAAEKKANTEPEATAVANVDEKSDIEKENEASQQDSQSERIPISIETHTSEIPEEYKDLMSSQYDSLSVGDGKYEKLESALENINETIENKANNNIGDFKRWLDMKSNKPENNEPLYSSEIYAEIKRADSEIVSIEYLTHIEIYDGHPIYESDAYNIDVISGKLLELSDIVSLNDDFYKMVAESIEKEYADVDFNENVNLEEDIRNYFENEEAFVQKYYFKKFSFYINDTDIFFVLGGLEISDDYGGDIVATIPINSKEIKKDYYIDK